MPMYAELGQVRQRVEAFEQCALPLMQWDHRAHVSVACWYVFDDDERCEQRMRRGIQRYNAYNGVFTSPSTGYHETLTLFWLAMVRATWYELPQTLSPLTRINKVVAELDDKMLVLDYYSRQLIVSDDARYGWVEPDLKSLPAIQMRELEQPLAAKQTA